MGVENCLSIADSGEELILSEGGIACLQDLDPTDRDQPKYFLVQVFSRKNCSFLPSQPSR